MLVAKLGVHGNDTYYWLQQMSATQEALLFRYYHDLDLDEIKRLNKHAYLLMQGDQGFVRTNDGRVQVEVLSDREVRNKILFGKISRVKLAQNNQMGRE